MQLSIHLPSTYSAEVVIYDEQSSNCPSTKPSHNCVTIYDWNAIKPLETMKHKILVPRKLVTEWKLLPMVPDFASTKIRGYSLPHFRHVNIIFAPSLRCLKVILQIGLCTCVHFQFFGLQSIENLVPEPSWSWNTYAELMVLFAGPLHWWNNADIFRIIHGCERSIESQWFL